MVALKTQPAITGDTFVGRAEELEMIRVAIEADGFQIVSIQGEGGIGTTSLLARVGKIYSERADLRVTDILDFFDTASHTRGGFQAMLIAPFATEVFGDYRRAREDYDTVRLVGMPGRTFEEHRERAGKVFVADSCRLTQGHRIVLLIDTFETVQDSMGLWLLDLISELEKKAGCKTKDATFIVAGRHNSAQQTEIATRFPGRSTYFELAPLKEIEIGMLFDELISEVPEDERK
jgi:hypothetical protein